MQLNLYQSVHCSSYIISYFLHPKVSTSLCITVLFLEVNCIFWRKPINNIVLLLSSDSPKVHIKLYLHSKRMLG